MKKKKGPNKNLGEEEEEGSEQESVGENDSDEAARDAASSSVARGQIRVHRQIRVQSGGLTRSTVSTSLPASQPPTIHIPVHEKYYLK